jgi:crotonobetainyl-CoA:carnitine CoA-transferase CaiB-like acyl-CoA transferase
MNAPRALEGVRVLDLATLLPGPMLAAMLGDLGADVVKVEPPTGDPLRVTGAMHGGHSLLWSLANRNKRSLIADLDDPDGLALVHRLTEVADVIVLNQPLHVLERWACNYEAIAERNPGAVVVLVSGYGADGPYAERAGTGTVLEAFGGLTHMTGEADGPPVLSSVPIGDYLGAFFGFQGVLAALYWRDACGGTGQFVDASIYEAVMQLLGPAMATWSPGQPAPSRTGSRIPAATPRNVYTTSDDRWVVISGPTDSQVARILEVINADQETRERFATANHRNEHAGELDAAVAGWVASHELTTVVASLVDARVPVTEVQDTAGLYADPHVHARSSITAIHDPETGDRLIPSPAPHLHATPPRTPSSGPALGADTGAVIRDWLPKS